ncbi:unnamed protein product [Blepharisma stoltei]|uniref:Uncharacterized protein n=1 Tax=Blepharisma stoltei TaxID=1481888 RepID=A0AAU9K7L8_9CILI|nr:unnamed protein product [Blepharisma stoltei]
MSSSNTLPLKRQNEKNDPSTGTPNKKAKDEFADAKLNGNLLPKQLTIQNSDEESVLLSDESDTNQNVKPKIIKKPKQKTPSEEESYNEEEEESEESQPSDEDYSESEPKSESESDESWDQAPKRGKKRVKKQASSDSDY